MAEGDVRLAELLGALSLACDAADGFPPEKVMRTAVLATELARAAALDDAVVRDAYYATIMRYLGCTGFAHEEAHLYGAGDDIGTRNVMAMADVAAPLDLVTCVVRGIGKGAAPARRIGAVARLLADPGAMKSHAQSQCDVSVRLATLVGASNEVRQALTQICERWDGRGQPHHDRGDALAAAIRISHIADVAEIVHHRAGREAARALVSRRAGGHLDPQLARTFVAEADRLLAAIEGSSVWQRFLDAEPGPPALAPASRIDDVTLAFAQIADLKSKFTAGHSTGVAALCERAANAGGHGEAVATIVRRAARLHDLGRLATPNRVWDKPGPLSPTEWERVRAHAYQTERIVAQSTALRPLAQIAAAAHERIDGSGYHRAVPGGLLDRAARLLAAADAYHAMCEPRPHRPARTATEAARLLAEEAGAGRLDRQAVRAVLDAAGERTPIRRGDWPAGLSDREVQVLRLVARGKSYKEVASELGISARTAQHHVIHIYEKIGVNSRAAATLFAVEQQLLD